MNSKQTREAKRAARVAKESAAAEVTPKVAVKKAAKPVKPVVEGAMPKLPKLPSASRARKPKPLVACTCGCNGMTKGLWVPGHDARARGWAIRIERGICKMGDVPANEQAGAKFMLKQRKELGTATEGIKLVKGKKSKPEPVAEPEQAEPSAAINE